VAPRIVRALLTVVMPVPAPILRTVAAPPIFKVATPELNREAVLVVEVISAEVGPLTAKSPPTSKLLLIEVEPVPEPMLIDEALPAILTLVVPVLNRLADEAPVSMVPPLTTRLPPNVPVPVPKNEKLGLVVVLPKDRLGAPLVVEMLR